MAAQKQKDFFKVSFRKKRAAPNPHMPLQRMSTSLDVVSSTLVNSQFPIALRKGTCNTHRAIANHMCYNSLSSLFRAFQSLSVVSILCSVS